MAWPITTFRLVSNPDGPGLHCGTDGLMLGGAPLLKRGGAGLEPRPAGELQLIFDAAYGRHNGVDAESRMSGLRSVARALGERDMARATMTSLFLRLPEISPAGLARVAEIDDLIKLHYESRRTVHPAGGGDHYNEDEPRDWHGRWTDGDRGKPNLMPAQLTFPIPIGPTLPGVGGTPNPKDDDFVYPVRPDTGAEYPANDQTNANTHAANDNRPKACPDPSFELDSNKRTLEQLLYQAQINKLPLGWNVILNGWRYDGCRDRDNVMLEAKYGGSWFLDVPEFIKPLLKEYKDTMLQAFRQNYNSDGRRVEWHFSDKEVADYWRIEFQNAGYKNIDVIYTPYDTTYNYNLIRVEKMGC